ncbi:MAG: hypothetical protein EAZ61_03810 [Oscillatoriales cyanobacterium]|nr:MAG: hypothetical protein EAZ61_03810 [Oscillatoriales cyanobacterium]
MLNLELLWNGPSLFALPLTLLFPSVPPVLAQFAYGFGVGSLLGVGLVFCGLALYLLRSMRPNLARDHDIFFAAVSLLCGGILFFQGWRLDPILQFGQFLMTGSAIFFAVESIRLRGIVTQQAKRSTPIVDDDRPVSSSYRTYDAELEEIEPYDAPPSQPLRRIAGSRDGRRTTRPLREAGAGYDEPDRRPRSARPDSRPADPRSPGSRPRRRPDATRDLNLRYDAAPEDDYSDEYGSGRGPRSVDRGDRPTRRPATGSRPSRPTRPSGEMEATLEGYDTYMPPGVDRLSKPDPYRDPTEARAARTPRSSDESLNYDDGYGTTYEESRPTSYPYAEEPPVRRPSRDFDDREADREESRPLPNDDYAEFYRDDDEYDTPRTASGSASSSTSGGSPTGEPEYDV